MIDRRLLALLAFVLVMSLAACGGKPTPTPAAGSTPSSAAGATSTSQAAETEATRAATAELAPTEAEEADLTLDNVSDGIAQLASYKSTLDMRFTGTDAEGQAVDKSWTMAEQFIQNPPAQHMTWTSSESIGDEPATTTTWAMISVGESQYMITVDAEGTESCMMLTSGDSSSLSPSLTPDMWGSISDARYLGTDTVNGVRSKHYAWKEGALVVWGLTGGKGETWVAVDGEYVVRQIVEGTGKGVFLAGTEETGTTTWEWNVTDANGSFQIMPPEGCESAAADIPIMADATDKAVIGDMVTYTSPSPMADVVNFYKAAMPEDGWEASGTPTEMDTYAQLEFTRDGNTAGLMISWDADKKVTSVFISVTKPQS